MHSFKTPKVGIHDVERPCHHDSLLLTEAKNAMNSLPLSAETCLLLAQCASVVCSVRDCGKHLQSCSKSNSVYLWCGTHSVSGFLPSVALPLQVVWLGQQWRLLQMVAFGNGQQSHGPRLPWAHVWPCWHHASPSGHVTTPSPRFLRVLLAARSAAVFSRRSPASPAAETLGTVVDTADAVEGFDWWLVGGASVAHVRPVKPSSQ